MVVLLICSLNVQPHSFSVVRPFPWCSLNMQLAGKIYLRWIMFRFTSLVVEAVLITRWGDLGRSKVAWTCTKLETLVSIIWFVALFEQTLVSWPSTSSVLKSAVVNDPFVTGIFWFLKCFLFPWGEESYASKKTDIIKPLKVVLLQVPLQAVPCERIVLGLSYSHHYKHLMMNNTIGYNLTRLNSAKLLCETTLHQLRM